MGGADHDRRVVADIVAEWAQRHGRPYRLILDGPAGGTFEHGGTGEAHQLDAVEFCRIVSGRAPGTGLDRCRLLAALAQIHRA